MRDQQVKVTRYVRTVLDGQLVVRRPGDRVTAELAGRLGIDVPAALSPRRVVPRDARLPAVWAHSTESS
jgi:hypothetical protein